MGLGNDYKVASRTNKKKAFSRATPSDDRRQGCLRQVFDQRGEEDQARRHRGRVGKAANLTGV